MPLMKTCRAAATVAALSTMLVPVTQAAAQQLLLSSLIVDLQAGKHDREDVEVLNRSTDRLFVSVAPREVMAPGSPSQSDREERDPEKLGLLVSPDRMILDPGQRKLVRFASLAPAIDHEHVYRVTVRPVAGQVQSNVSALKVMVGYDVLVLVRPAVARPQLSGIRGQGQITFRNDGNVSLVLHAGKQCDAPGKCTDLPGKRLYAGASWTTPVKPGGTIDYVVDGPGTSEPRRF